MDFFIRIDINLFALVLLGILFISVIRNSDTHLFHAKLFLTMLYVNASLLIIDSILWSVDGQSGLLFLNLNRYVNLINFILNPLAAVLWLHYVDYHIFEDEDRLQKRRLLYFSPVLINAPFAIASLFNGFIYYIDSANIYHRGPGFALVYILTFGTIVYTWFLSYNNRNFVDSRALLSLQFFIVPILFGAIIQIILFGTVLIWTGMSLSLLIVFISIEMRKIYRDYLTGAHSRRQLDEYINYRIRLSKKSKGFTISMIDMDDFKEINDLYGHHEGDQALVNLVKLINQSVRLNDFIARFAGDEFVIVFDFEDEKILEDVLNRIYQNVKEYNEAHSDSYQLKFSIGTEIVKRNDPCDFDELFKRIDTKMYEEKKRKKAEV